MVAYWNTEEHSIFNFIWSRSENADFLRKKGKKNPFVGTESACLFYSAAPRRDILVIVAILATKKGGKYTSRTYRLWAVEIVFINPLSIWVYL
jgi:hypothetical protein